MSTKRKPIIVEPAEGKSERFEKLSFHFGLVYENHEDYTEAAQQYPPKQIINTGTQTILFLESDRNVVKRKGITLNEKFFDHARFIVSMPDPDFGCLGGYPVVEFSGSTDEADEVLPIKHGEADSIIRDYFLFKPQIDEETIFNCLTIVAKQLDPTVISVSINQDTRSCICEAVLDDETRDICYTMRTPPSKTIDVKKTKPFEDHAIEFFNRK